MRNSTFIGFLAFMFMSSGILQGNENTLLVATAFGVAALLCHSIERVERTITGITITRYVESDAAGGLPDVNTDTPMPHVKTPKYPREVFVKRCPHPDFPQPEESMSAYLMAIQRCSESGGCDEPGRRCDGCPKERESKPVGPPNRKEKSFLGE